jgi:Flp pilus assembly pilin Flp
MVEYAFILVLVVLVVLSLLVSTGHQLMNLYSNITAKLASAGTWLELDRDLLGLGSRRA